MRPAPLLPSARFPGMLQYDRIGSTNDAAKQLGREGKADGTVVCAREQTTGRGRRERVWHSPPGNLYVSLLLRPDAPAPRAAQLGFVAALGLGDALLDIAGRAIEPRYKWPNDVLVRGRKLAGILLESETGADGRLDFVVIGVGVNILAAPEDVEYPSTSLMAEGIAGVTPAEMLAAFAKRFGRWERRWQRVGFAPVRKAWLARAAGLGEQIRVRLERTTLLGRFVDLDHDGTLLLDAADGRHRITAGEVFPAAA
jgi:BirA family biotin operon repressor/biotin-[acetyl-CoA-carboxylase] ligase